MGNLIYKTLIISHVIAGFAALLTGFIAMKTRKKGGKIHNTAGQIYYWGMVVVFLSTVGLFILAPQKLFYQFFLGIAIVSFYPTFSGKRILGMKKAIQPQKIDWFAAIIVTICGFVMWGYAIYGFFHAADFNSFQYLFAIFGSICLANGYGDLMVFTKRKKTEKMHWFFGHGGKMTGGYAATVTAFCVNIVPRYLPENLPTLTYLMIWVLPGVLIGFWGNRMLKSYKQKQDFRKVVYKLG